MSAIRKLLKPFIPKSVVRDIRLAIAAKKLREFYFGTQLKALKPIMFSTGETHNFTYDLTDDSLLYLAEMIAVATLKRASEIEGYISEAIGDKELRQHFDRLMAMHDGQKTPPNTTSPFGRRLGWYAVARALKPKIIVETGVERGHGALLLCAALKRNTAEGYPGRYFGTDINPAAGWLLSGPYAAFGKILAGDSIMSLRALPETIDLFINDSDHSADYEGEEYQVIAPMLSEQAIVLGDNAHVTAKLARFSRETGRSFIMFNERPKDHWYPGGGIGISFRNTHAAQP